MTCACSRRDFLKSSALLGVPLLAGPRLVFSQSSNPAVTRDTLVVIYQRGAMDGLNAVVPHGDADYYRLRPSINIPRPGNGANAVLDLDGYFGLHPALAALKPLWDTQRLAVLHATGAPTGNRSHFVSQDIMERAYLGTTQVTSGWLNRHLQSIGVDTTFQAIGVGTAVQKSLSGAAPVIGIKGFDNFNLTTQSPRSDQIKQVLSGLYGNAAFIDNIALRGLGAIDQLAVADPDQFAAENGAEYPRSEFGSQMQEIAQLIKSGIGVEVAAVDIGGWDHHYNELPRIAPLLDDLAKSLAAFCVDLGARMDDVTVVTMSEFGRRAYENASGGTDHGTGSCMFLLGGGVNGGRVYGQWPGLADAQLYQGDLAISTDYRSLLAEILGKRHGETAQDAVFPEFAGAVDLGMLRERVS